MLRNIGNLAAAVLGVVVVVIAWMYYSPVIVYLLDANLTVIKFICSHVTAPYGAMLESALRGGLGFDKALLFFEGSLIVKIVFFVIKTFFFPSAKPTKKN